MKSNPLRNCFLSNFAHNLIPSIRKSFPNSNEIFELKILFYESSIGKLVKSDGKEKFYYKKRH